MKKSRFVSVALIGFLLMAAQNLVAESEVERILDRIDRFVKEGNLEEVRDKTADLRFIHMLILDLKRGGTPEAASALMSIVLDPEVSKFDQVPCFNSYWQVETVLGNTPEGVAGFAARELAKLPLQEMPAILSVSWLKEGPNQTESLVAYGKEYPAQFVADCRAWCEEVRDGKRTLKFKGDSREYDFHGKSLTSRANTRGGGPGRSDEAKRGPEDDRKAGEKVPMWTLMISGVALLGACGYWWMGRKSVIRR